MSTPAAGNVEKVHVTRTPGVCGGKPCVAGTRIRVWDVYVWHEVHGATPAEIVAEFPSLTFADVHAALAYFWDHEADIREEMRRAEELVEDLMRKAPPSKLDAYRAGKATHAGQVSPR